MDDKKVYHMNHGPKEHVRLMKLYLYEYSQTNGGSRSASWSHNHVSAEAALGATVWGQWPTAESGWKPHVKEARR